MFAGPMTVVPLHVTAPQGRAEPEVPARSSESQRTRPIDRTSAEREEPSRGIKYCYTAGGALRCRRSPRTCTLRCSSMNARCAADHIQSMHIQHTSRSHDEQHTLPQALAPNGLHASPKALHTRPGCKAQSQALIYKKTERPPRDATTQSKITGQPPAPSTTRPTTQRRATAAAVPGLPLQHILVSERSSQSGRSPAGGTPLEKAAAGRLSDGQKWHGRMPGCLRLLGRGGLGGLGLGGRLGLGGALGGLGLGGLDLRGWRVGRGGWRGEGRRGGRARV